MNGELEEPGPSEGTDGAAPQRLYLHVGLPKSGSTFLQSVLGNHRAALRAHGYGYPYVRQEGMFHAAVEMAGAAERWGLDPEEIDGTFAHLLRRGRRLGGRVVISHEIFGSATPKQIQIMGEQLEDFDVHLVVTVRDLGRTLAASWQEGVKNGRSQSFAQFSSALVDSLPTGPEETDVFWRSQNLGDLLERWQALVPPARTHIVVCPPSGAAPEVLWNRFAGALDLPTDAVELSDVPVRNESLGAAQIAFLRQVLDALDGRVEQPWFSRVVKRWFAQTLLSQARSPRPVTPGSVAERLTGVSRAWIELIGQGGYVVHGDLDELLPQIAPEDTPHPDQVTAADMLQGLPEVVADMLVRTRDLRLTLEALAAENEALCAARDDLAEQVAQLTAAAARRSRRWWRP